MKKGVIWIVLACFIVTSLVLASCSSSTTTSTLLTIPAPTATTTTTSTTVITPTSTTATAVVTIRGNYYIDRELVGQSGYTNLWRNANDLIAYQYYWMGQSYNDSGMTSIIPAYEEALTTDDWTLNPSVFAYNLSYRSSNYEVGYLGSSWEFTIPKLNVAIYAENV